MKEQLINVVDVIRNAYQHVDSRLSNHGERVAYILMKMLEDSPEFSPQDKQDIFMLGLLHDVGAYKKEEIDAMLSFDLGKTMEHSIFGYLLFQRFSPLPDYGDVILYHHNYNAQYYSVPIDEYHRKLARFIHLADRIDIFCLSHKTEELPAFLYKNQHQLFSIDDILWFLQSDETHHILDRLLSGAYKKDLTYYTSHSLLLSGEQLHDYLLMFIYSIDFRNSLTATHTSYAVHLSKKIAQMLRLTSTSCKIVELSALLHNIGKISLPSQLQTMDDYDIYLKRLNEYATLEITHDILSEAVDTQILQIIDQSFQLIHCWANNSKVTFSPSPAVEIVSMSYLISNAITLDSDIGANHCDELLPYLKEKYRLCGQDPSTLLAVEKHYSNILLETTAATETIQGIYRNMKNDNHSLNMILTHYNKKYL
ncbi:MAG: HD domain-containing protein [Lachnospiraceae bacterium]